VPTHSGGMEIFMKKCKNMYELMHKNPDIYKYYNDLPYEVQQMLDQENKNICTEKDFLDCISSTLE